MFNLFLLHGKRQRFTACFKRIADHQGWSTTSETKEGLVLDREFLLKQGFDNANARMDELVHDGVELLSFWKHPAPGGRVSYLLVSWPTNVQLEANRAKRIGRKPAKQKALPREVSPFRREQPHHVAELAGKRERTTTRHEDATRFELQYNVKPRPSTTSTTKTFDLPLFDGGKNL